MFRKPICVLAVTVLMCAQVAQAQTARDILETAQQKQVERWEGVDSYTVEQSTIGGQTATTWFVRTDIEEDGEVRSVFLPRSDIQAKRAQCDGSQMSPEALEAYASGSEMMGDAMAGEIESGMEEAGLPRGLLAATGSDPWNTMDPRVMMGGNATFLRAAADAQREQIAYDPSIDAREKLDHLSSFLNEAKLVGKDKVDGKSVWHLRADGIDQVQKADGQEFHMDSISLYVDTAEYVPLKMRVDGRMIAGGESRPMYLENIQSDYRRVPGSGMYESYHQVMKMAGVMTPQQEAEMQEAMAQFKDMEKQLAEMPPDQRRMVENMMGPQMEMMRNMASGGGFQTEVTVKRITVNPGGKEALNVDCDSAGMVATVEEERAAPATGSATVVEDNLVSMVQRDLTTLGYETGGVTGEMNTPTIVSISKFQAENQMEVTGEVTPQLAGILSAHVSGAASAPAVDPQELQAARQACLQKKVEEAQAKQKKKRGLGSLVRGVSRVAGITNNSDLWRKTNDIYTAGATAEDFAQAAKDLGLTEDDVAACENPL